VPATESHCLLHHAVESQQHWFRPIVAGHQHFGMPGKNRKPQLLTACVVAAAAWCVIIGRLLAFVCLQHSLLSVSNSTARSQFPNHKTTKTKKKHLQQAHDLRLESLHTHNSSPLQKYTYKRKNCFSPVAFFLVHSHVFPMLSKQALPIPFPSSLSLSRSIYLSIYTDMYIYHTNLSTIFFSGPDDELRCNQCGKKKHYKLFLSLIIKTGKGTSYATRNCNTKREIRHQNRRRRRETQRRKQKAECRVRRRDRSQQTTSRTKRTVNNSSKKKQKQRKWFYFLITIRTYHHFLWRIFAIFRKVKF